MKNEGFTPPIYGLQPLKMKVVGSHGIIIYTLGLPLTCSSCRDSPFKYFQFSLGAKKSILSFWECYSLGGSSQFSHTCTMTRIFVEEHKLGKNMCRLADSPSLLQG